MSQDELLLLRRQVQLQRELDTLLRDYDARMARYDLDYHRATTGDRMKSVPTGTFKTFPIWETRTRKSGSMGETWTDRYQVQVGSEQVEQYKRVPDYPEKPQKPKRIYEIQQEIAKIEKTLDAKSSC